MTIPPRHVILAVSPRLAAPLDFGELSRVAERGERPSSGAAKRNAFTLTELLIVIGLIVLFITLALPAFNLISGSKSIAGAENQIGAFLGRARAEAVGFQEIRGVCFSLDAASGRWMMAIVQQPFQSAQSIATYSSTTAKYPQGTYVQDGSGHYYVAKKDLLNPIPPLPASDDANWNQTDAYAVDAVSDTDILPLPVGVGAQLVNNCTITAGARTSNGYVSYGAILFDGSGSLVSRRISIAQNGIVGSRSHLTEDLPYPLSGGAAVYSQFGVVLFDINAYTGAGGSLAYQGIFASTPNYPTSDLNQENWLDTNATPLLVNRYNGTLVKGE